MTPGEVIIIVNAYGINAMCIDTVLEARNRKMTSIAITSREFADRLAPDHPSRHPSGRNLYQEADYYINCHLPYGDAVVEIEGCPQKTGPTSTMCNVFAINLLMGLTSISTTAFFLASLVGMAPGTMVFINAGTQLAQLDSVKGLLSPTLIASFVLLAVFPYIAKYLLKLIKQRLGTESESSQEQN